MTPAKAQGRRRLRKGDRVRDNLTGAIEKVARVLDGGNIIVTEGFDGDGHWRATYTRAGLIALPRPSPSRKSRRSKKR